MKQYTFFNRWRTLRDLHRWYDQAVVFRYRGMMTHEELLRCADWVIEQKEKLDG